MTNHHSYEFIAILGKRHIWLIPKPQEARRQVAGSYVAY